MVIQNIASAFQIVFYIVGSTVAVMTYISAKKGLLNTVNTEYHKRSMDHLEALSKRLFEFSSTEKWLQNEFKNDQYIIELIENHQQDKRDENIFAFVTIKENQLVKEFEDLISSIKSEPFLPEEISVRVIRNLENKVETWSTIYNRGISELQSNLLNATGDIDVESTLMSVQNSIGNERRKKGCSIEDLENEIEDIRIYIRSYLKSFDPFYKKKK